MTILELEWTSEIMELGNCKLKGIPGPRGNMGGRALYPKGPAIAQLYVDSEAEISALKSRFLYMKTSDLSILIDKFF